MDPIINRTVYRQQIYMSVFYEKHYFYRAVIRIYNYKYYMLFERKPDTDFNNEKNT